ncbi:gfo/Idh/MocA family oxidoreductase, partial [bacterium]|nr:gfo/Idh/MocA family oxidoreductase [bacterium]
MTSQKTPVAVVGLGNMGRYHIKHYLNLPSSHVVAVVDQDPSRLSQFAVDGVRGFRSVSELLASGLAEAVSITVPTSLHFKVAQECLLAGLHVLIEKPITESVSDAEELIRLAESMNKIIQVGHIERFNPAVLKLLEWQKEGKTGRIYSIETRRFSPMPTQILDANVIIDLAVHDIDIVCALFNSQPTDISREMAMNTLSDRADSGIILLRFPDGIASVSVNWTSPVKTRTLTAFCE